MDVFVRNLAPGVTDKDLKKSLEPVLAQLSITSFSCQKVGIKNANITFLHVLEARNFLRFYGPGTQRFSQIRISGQPMYFSESTRAVDPFQLRSLEMEVKKKRQKKDFVPDHSGSVHSQEKVKPAFDISFVGCGDWSYAQDELVFSMEYSHAVPGRISFGKRGLVVFFTDELRIDFDYSIMDALTISDHLPQSITVSCIYAPVFSSDPNSVMEDAELSVLLAKFLKINNQKKERERLTNLGSDHKDVVQSCLVYRFGISQQSTIPLRRLGLPSAGLNIIHQQTRTINPSQPFKDQFRQMMTTLRSSATKYTFPLLFQLQKLAQNALMHPSTVMLLIPEAMAMMDRSGVAIAAEAVSKLGRNMPSRGPETDAYHFRTDSLIEWLQLYEARAKLEVRKEESTNRAKIFRAKVTPAGFYLYGPSWETKNRVLRQYSEYLDFFIRVEFCDEDGQRLQHHPKMSNDKIFYERFREVLQNGIDIAGRIYGFLGYSHSSLRAQTCWFMASFYHEADKELKFYQKLIADLGDFSHIQSPAKCAARIGQTFSETSITVPLGDVVVRNLPDVERNGRVFSDGVGVFSESVLDHIWDALPAKNRLKPTVFQIRHRGAKGMLSLNSHLQDHCLLLRPSMIKFEGSPSTDIELCGFAGNPLPMYLNRQLIKILEDLGVDRTWFLNLQDTAVHRLQESITSDIKAAEFLSAQNVGGIMGLPKFIKQLIALNLSFTDDHFLCNILKTTVMVELRALKHRSSILVENGYTLYGIMDETGFLKEGEVFVTYDTKSGQQKMLVQRNVMISRSPALHPGDVKLANAVDVPSNSPLRKLGNVIVFSQHGARDLPSQLSGGDLDGDLYHVIFDRNLGIKRLYGSADYPRQAPIDIGRSVEREDMISLVELQTGGVYLSVTYVRSLMSANADLYTSTLHVIKADQSEEGTVDSDCIKLAELHSTAVDYSKTGIKVDLSKMPKYSAVRPHFMAPGPNVTISKIGDLAVKQKEDEDDDENEDGFRSYKYYESEKVLGDLYDAIDEEAVFMKIQQGARGSPYARNIGAQRNQPVSSILSSVWQYLKSQCTSLKWKHHLEEAKDIRAEYEDCLATIILEFSTLAQPVTETEVVVGNIVGKSGAPNRKQRESSKTMKELYDEDLSYILKKIRGSNSDPSLESLERALACLECSLGNEHVRNMGKKNEMVSFKYIVAALCLRELDLCRGGKLSTRGALSIRQGQ